ncbi:hypothetical protein ACLOJK_018701 [Asimina triloba]
MMVSMAHQINDHPISMATCRCIVRSASISNGLIRPILVQISTNIIVWQLNDNHCTIWLESIKSWQHHVHRPFRNPSVQHRPSLNGKPKSASTHHAQISTYLQGRPFRQIDDCAHSDHSILAPNPSNQADRRPIGSDHSKGPVFRPKAGTTASNRRQQESRPNQHPITSQRQSVGHGNPPNQQRLQSHIWSLITIPWQPMQHPWPT